MAKIGMVDWGNGDIEEFPDLHTIKAVQKFIKENHPEKPKRVWVQEEE